MANPDWTNPEDWSEAASTALKQLANEAHWFRLEAKLIVDLFREGAKPTATEMDRFVVRDKFLRKAIEEARQKVCP